MVEIINAVPGATFVPSTPFQLRGERVVLDWDIVITAGARVEWFLEFTSDNPLAATARWRREVAEEDVGGGVTDMPQVVRNFQVLGGGVLPTGTHRLSAQMVRAHNFARIQVRVASGTVTGLNVFAVFGTSVSAPQT